MKTKYIERFTLKDLQVLYGLSRVGHFSPDQIKELGITDRRTKNMVKDKLMEVKTYRHKSQEYEAYKLTERGYKFLLENIRGELRDKLDLGETDRYSSSSIRHDLALADKYLKLSWEEQQTWRTESMSRDQFNEYLDKLQEDKQWELYYKLQDQYRDREITMPDGVYTSSSGEVVAVEVIGSKYTGAMIESKVNYCDTMGIEFNGYRY